MSIGQEGPALVVIYIDGRCRSVLLHPHDGGESYMGPVLRRGVAYARTHYESGNIRDVLMSEPEMQLVQPAAWLSTDAIHLYYVEVSWDEDAARKQYAVRALHKRQGSAAEKSMVPARARDIPSEAKKLV